MALFQEGSPERQLTINDGSERLSEIIRLFLESYREIRASRLEGEQKEAFLRAFPVMGKAIIIDASMKIDLRQEKETKRG